MKRLRRCIRWLRASALLAGGGLWWARRRLQTSESIVVLAFHRVLDDADLRRTHSLSGMLMRRHTFERLAAYVSSRYEPVDLSHAAPARQSTRLRVAFTFDDGWADNHAIVLPIARAYGIPLTIFICPGVMGVELPFWPERVAAAIKAARIVAREEDIEAAVEGIKSLSSQERDQALATLSGAADAAAETRTVDRSLGWEEVLLMHEAGTTIGAHTHTHQILTTVSDRTARAEITASKAAIEDRLHKPCRLFAYPNGNHCRDTREILADAGFELAFTTVRGAWTAACDRLAIPRQGIAEDDVTGPTGRFSPAMFEYAAFWEAYRAGRPRAPKRRLQSDFWGIRARFARRRNVNERLTL